MNDIKEAFSDESKEYEDRGFMYVPIITNHAWKGQELFGVRYIASTEKDAITKFKNQQFMFQYPTGDTLVRVAKVKLIEVKEKEESDA